MHPAQCVALDVRWCNDRDDHAEHNRPGNVADSGQHDVVGACYGAGYAFRNVAGDGYHDAHVCRRPGRVS